MPIREISEHQKEAILWGLSEDERRRESYKGYEENMPDADKARERGSMQHLDDAEAFSTTATKPTAFNFP